MPKVEALNEMAHLKRTGFGRKAPRHGLKLLYWFASEYVFVDENIVLCECNPESGEFGFHLFKNRYDENNVQLLPGGNYSYYAVGNLNSAGAEYLPYYVREDYTGLRDNSNIDRIIVSLNDECVDKVYITTHDRISGYDKNSTYRITSSLLTIISRMNLDDFLMKMGYSYPEVSYYSPQAISMPSEITPAASNVKPTPTKHCRIVIESKREDSSLMQRLWKCTIL